MGDVVEVAFHTHLADRFARSRARAESTLRVATSKAFAPEKTDLGIERVADGQMLDVHPVPIGGVGELRHVARFVAPASGRSAPGVVTVERHVLKERERGIDTNDLIGIVSDATRRPLRTDEPDGAPPEDAASHAYDGKVRGRRARSLRFFGFNVQQTQRVAARASS